MAKQRFVQPLLFSTVQDLRIETNASLRNYVGEFWEEATAVVTGGKRLKTEAGCACPDLEFNGYHEVKSAGRNGNAVVFQHRLRKDLATAEREQAPMVYWIWHHKASVYGTDYLFDLHASLAAALVEVCVVSVLTVAGIVETMPPRMMNYSNKTAKGDSLGYGKNGYGLGWSLRVTRLREVAKECFVRTVGQVYATQIGRVRFNVEPGLEEYLPRRRKACYVPF